ncbi:MAG: HD-GYP domain-containing protein [Nitrosomonadales bacterium]|nr:HD-GYP domain-containing protein [Nitrosomonadales bacterium]
MIKRIRSEQLKPGMFIHDLNCGWIDHPFLFNSFMVDNEKTAAKIIANGIRELYIDPDKGLDATDAQTRDEFHAEINDQITTLAASHVIKHPPPPPLHQEISQARNVHREAHKIVHHLMSDVRMGKQIELEKVSPTVERITDSIFRNKDAFISLSRIKIKDEYTFQHSVSVCALMVAFSRELEFEKGAILDAGIGGLLHDVGKMHIPSLILNKPSTLTTAELGIMRSHATIGCELLKQTPSMPESAIIITRQHHERYDGTGYPDKLKNGEISQLGQIAAIADVYDALTSNRIYHKGMEPTDALRKLFEWSRFHFNATLVQRFICLIGIYPVGSLVKLESGKLAIVVNPGNENLLRPTVRAVFDLRREHAITPRDIDLSTQLGDRIIQHESPRHWGINTFNYL